MEMVQTQCVACKGTGRIDGRPCGCFGGKRLYAAKAFHTCQGLYFQGKSDGSIEICLDESGAGLGKFIGVTINKDTWQSMLKEIAPGGAAHLGAGAAGGRGREVNERGEAMNQQNELLSDVVICDTWRSAHTQDENCMNPVPAERCSECGQYAQVLFQNCWCFKCYLKWMRQHGQWPITGEDSDDTTSG